MFGPIRVYPFAYTKDFEKIAVVCPFCHYVHLHNKSGFQTPDCKTKDYLYYIKPEDRPLPVVEVAERKTYDRK
jgi:hypothetical protein